MQLFVMKRDSPRTNMKYVCGYFENCDPTLKISVIFRKQYHLVAVILQLYRPKKKPEKAYTWARYVLGQLVSRISAMA